MDSPPESAPNPPLLGEPTTRRSARWVALAAVSAVVVLASVAAWWLVVYAPSRARQDRAERLADRLAAATAPTWFGPGSISKGTEGNTDSYASRSWELPATASQSEVCAGIVAAAASVDPSPTASPPSEASPCHGYERAAPLTSSYFVTRAGNGTWHAELNIGADANWAG